ncbi:hypothetical protein B0T25DRAFT_461972 [Lasiosphaeria hispida]|uniref:Uncharacterized protein n=1 Tax=Lasiosphaeria hispida TaxID=260671 RepID=A0AAJ0HCS1_9PEZI|nr:hypothetical protein B0T25DRAFT_461972 [Lasiosphaeria hispida]
MSTSDAPAAGAAAVEAPPPLVPEEGDDDRLAAWGPTIRSLFKSGHPKWGFLIYRVSYDDDEAWQRFMGILNRVSDNWIRRSRKERLLPYLFWTTMEDRAAFEGASKDAIRDHFRNWISTRSVERDGPGADNPIIAERSPRYRACLYVDKEVMESATLAEYPSAVNPTGFFLKVGGRDGDLAEEDLEEDEYDPIEGKSTFDVGWQYVDLQLTTTIYDTMCENYDAWIRPHFYQRPPAVWGLKN